jgi:hypothetical protein
VNLDWRRLRAVVLESDDWGLCAWSPDVQAHRVLSDTPAFRSPAGRRYGGSTLESAADVRSLVQTLMEFRGGDGFPPVWQANTVMATPDYARLNPPLFEMENLPLLDYPKSPARWHRPGAWDETAQAIDSGHWWPELHGLHHLPEHAWITALRRGNADARRAHEHQSPICMAVEASGEYDASEPWEIRHRNLEQAIKKFHARFGRDPHSFCPPDYRWDERIESLAERLGIATLQGKGEQVGRSFPKLQRLMLRTRWRHQAGPRFHMPPRIAFEPCGAERRTVQETVQVCHRLAREAWGRSHPAVLSTHRVNYAHLDPAWASKGRAALRDLLERLASDGAIFLVDAEVRQLHDRSWSVRPVGQGAVLLRYHGVPREAVRFPARPGAERVTIREGRGPDDVDVSIAAGEVIARVNVGEYLLEWSA